MKSLYNIIESLLDDEDEIIDKATGPINIWLKLQSSYSEWESAVEELLKGMFSKKVKEIAVPAYRRAAVEKFRSKLNNDDYYLYIKRSAKDKLLLVATSHGLENMYVWGSDEVMKSGKPKVNRFSATTPAKLCKITGSNCSEKLYVLPKEYIWLYRRMKEDFENNNK